LTMASAERQSLQMRENQTHNGWCPPKDAREELGEVILSPITKTTNLSFASSRVPWQGSSPPSFCIQTASPAKRRSKRLSRMTGNCHLRFLEGRAPVMGSG
jgi:hypothetical protein